MSGHAVLSPSSAHRWLVCTPSALWERDFPDTAGEAAQEGTQAHEYAAQMLSAWYGSKGYSNPAGIELARAAIPKDCPEDMAEYVWEYLALVAERYGAALEHCPDPELYIETKVSLEPWIPDGYGTADAVIVADGTLEIIDFKYGRGVRVDAADNPQLSLYALGAVNAAQMFVHIREVRMTICQPRVCDGTSTRTLSADTLLEWGYKHVAPRAERAAKGAGEFLGGEHCKFCRAKARCEAYADWATAITRSKFALTQPCELSNEDIAQLLEEASRYTEWISALQAYTLADMLTGGEYPGWKLVEGRSIRKYADTLAVAEALRKAGYDEAMIYTKELLGITAMEKAIGKKKFTTLLGDLIHKPPGKPTIAPETDKRPAITTREDIKSSLMEG